MLTTVLLKKSQTAPSEEILEQAIPFKNYVKNLIQNNVISSSDPVGQNYCVAPSVIESQIPFWIKQNYGTDSNENYLIAFLKSYYNWIYCGFKKQDVQLTPYDIEELLDIDRVPDAFLDEYIKSYAPFISLPSISAVDKQYVRSFIRSIKSDFLNFPHELLPLHPSMLHLLQLVLPLPRHLGGLQNLNPQSVQRLK